VIFAVDNNAKTVVRCTSVNSIIHLSTLSQSVVQGVVLSDYVVCYQTEHWCHSVPRNVGLRLAGYAAI